MKKIIKQAGLCLAVILLIAICSDLQNPKIKQCVDYINARISTHYAFKDIKAVAKQSVLVFERATKTFSEIAKEDGK